MVKCYNNKYFGDVMKRIYVQDFGYKKLETSSVEGIDYFLLVKFTHKKKDYTGIVNKKGEIIIPFSTDLFVEVFTTNDKNECCFTMKKENGGFRSYHFSKQNNCYLLKADIYGNDSINCRLVNTINDNYWFVESINDGLCEVSLYDPRRCEILTPAFTDLSFEEREGRVLAFVEKSLYKKEDGQQFFLGSILSYIDKDGNFLTPFYVPELNKFYESRYYNADPNFKGFRTFCGTILPKLEEIEKEKNDYITDVLQTMYSDLYDKDNLTISHELAKIIKFPGGSNETK